LDEGEAADAHDHGPDSPPAITAAVEQDDGTAQNPASRAFDLENPAPPHGGPIEKPNASNEPQDGQAIATAADTAVSGRVRFLQEKRGPPSLNQQLAGGLNAGSALTGVSKLPNDQPGRPLPEELKENQGSGSSHGGS